MSTNRLKVLLVSVMAVFAVSAVASASASATCLQVAVAGTGNTDSSCVTNVGVTKNEYIVGTKEKELIPGEWCAKVATGAGPYTTNLCTTMGAPKEFIKVFVPFWQVCKEGGSEKFTEHKCKTTSGTGKWSWLKLETGESFNVVSKGGTQELVLDTGGEQPTIICKHVTDTANIKGGQPGTDEVTKLEYTECKINIPGCAVVKTAGEANGTIVVPPGLKTELFGPFDRVSPASGTTFVTLELGVKENASKEAEGICSPLTAVKNKVEGTAVAQVEGENLNFKGEGTLTVDGIKSELKGLDEQELENGWAFRTKL